MKKRMALFAAFMLALLCAAALADGSVLLFQLPEDAVTLESVDFGDGEFIETYQLPDGTMVQNLRFMTPEMSLQALVQGDWATCSAVEPGEITMVSGYAAQSCEVTQHVDENGYPVGSAEEAGAGEMHIRLVAAYAPDCTLVMQIILPQGADEQAAQQILDSLQVGGVENSEEIVG